MGQGWSPAFISADFGSIESNPHHPSQPAIHFSTLTRPSKWLPILSTLFFDLPLFLRSPMHATAGYTRGLLHLRCICPGIVVFSLSTPCEQTTRLNCLFFSIFGRVNLQYSTPPRTSTHRSSKPVRWHLFFSRNVFEF